MIGIRKSVYLTLTPLLIILSGCMLTTIGGNRDATPLGKSNSAINLRTVSNLVAAGAILEYNYGYNEKNDIGINTIAGISLEDRIVYGFGVNSFHLLRDKYNTALVLHGEYSDYEQIHGYRLIKGQQEYLAYEGNWIRLGNNTNYASHYIIGYAGQKGLTFEMSAIGNIPNENWFISVCLGYTFRFNKE